ncbi:hypothetical protein [Francisella persica]|uniref:hypothetical protein n=1 Tax=Francisella persica TaxID=954 RepID=UPI000B26954E|nr:hypothetical protein [Francisella persica]
MGILLLVGIVGGCHVAIGAYGELDQKQIIVIKKPHYGHFRINIINQLLFRR